MTIRAFFRKVKIEGKHYIPVNEPCIFIANHPSAFMDPIVVATSISPAVYFLAAGEYMGNGIKYWIMNKLLHMIPVYRPETMPGKAHKNDAIFDKCISHLKNNKSILVFPEGVSVTEKKITPLKTGVARIAAATLAKDRQIRIKIIPIGLNYSDPHEFRSDLLVKIGKPIEAAEYFDNDQDSFEDVKRLTADMETALRDTVLHIENTELEELLAKVSDTYSRDLKSDLQVDFHQQDREFEMNKTLVDALHHFHKKSPSKLESIESLTDSYLTALDERGFTDRDFRNADKSISIGQKLFLIFTLPIFFIGLIFNWIPYQLSSFVRHKIKVDESFSGSITLAIGLIVFLLWYIAVVICTIVFTPLTYFSLLLPLLMYPTGIFALVYKDIYQYFKRRWEIRDFSIEKPGEYENLRNMRSSLISHFEILRKEFEQKMSD